MTLRTVVGDAVLTVRAAEGIPVDPIHVAVEVENRIETDPVLANELNQEAWWQSGVGVFGSGGLIWAVVILLAQVSRYGTEFGDYDTEIVVTALGALVSAAGVLYRRFWPGLRPMFSWF